MGITFVHFSRKPLTLLSDHVFRFGLGFGFGWGFFWGGGVLGVWWWWWFLLKGASSFSNLVKIPTNSKHFSQI